MPFAPALRSMPANAGTLREIRLRDKPTEFFSASPNATVPVLVQPDGHVIDESRDIMIWALQQSDPRGWLRPWQADREFCDAFIDRLDGPFKQQLDRYKYASRFEPSIGQQSRQDACVFLTEINQFLESRAGHLSGADFGVLDAATLPFVRQFRGVDEIWFDSQPWPNLHRWLGMFLTQQILGRSCRNISHGNQPTKRFYFRHKRRGRRCDIIPGC